MAHEGTELADELAVIRAAEAWVSAIEATAEAAEKGAAIASEKDAVRLARIALYDAVLALRATHGPADFTGVHGSKARRRSRIVELLIRD